MGKRYRLCGIRYMPSRWIRVRSRGFGLKDIQGALRVCWAECSPYMTPEREKELEELYG